MIEPLFDNCAICGRPARKPGEGLCTYHDFEGLIILGYERMIKNNKREVRRTITRLLKHLRMSDIREVK